MRFAFVYAALASAVFLAGCNAMGPAQIASVSCAGAEMGAAVAVAVTTDANVGANATRAASRAQQTAGAVQRVVEDTCPLIVGGVGALNVATHK